jgi:hypothetical protein
MPTAPLTPTISDGAGSLYERHAQDLDVGAARWQPGGRPQSGPGRMPCMPSTKHRVSVNGGQL